MHHAATHPGMTGSPASTRREWRVYTAVAIGFLAAALPTAYFCWSMRQSMPMPGGWRMGMAWMPMGGWLSSTAMFAGMWLAMMVAMMLPSTLPVLLLYRRVLLFRSAPHAGWKCSVLAGGYFLSWFGFGVLAYAAGTAIVRSAMHWDGVSRAVPALAGAALLLAGAFQLTPLKQACLRHCRDPLLLLANHADEGWRGALVLGLHHGAFCIACCWALMLVQLVVGVMNAAIMAAIALVIALEKLLPRGDRLAPAAGLVIFAAGAVSLAKALALLLS